jgi:hypothetical protein
VAGVAIAAIGAPATIAVDAASFLLSALFIARIRTTLHRTAALAVVPGWWLSLALFVDARALRTAHARGGLNRPRSGTPSGHLRGAVVGTRLRRASRSPVHAAVEVVAPEPGAAPSFRGLW